MEAVSPLVNPVPAIRQVVDIRCLCGKLLTKAMIAITGINLGENEFQSILRVLKVEYGAQTKCRNCKKLRESQATLAIK